MPSPRFHNPPKPIWALTCVLALGLLFAPPALARFAYVTNSGDGTVTVLQTDGNTAVTTIPVGGTPVDVAVTPDGSRALVVNSTGNSVIPIDTKTQTPGAPIAVGANPGGIAISPDGRLAYVSNHDADSVSVISLSSLAAVGAPIAVGSHPEGIAFTPDGRLAYVAQQGGDVTAIDTATATVAGTFADASGPSRIAVVPTGTRAFVTDGGGATVSAFSVSTGAIVGTTIPAGTAPDGIAIDPVSLLAYAASPGDGTVTPVDTSILDAAGPPIQGFPGATGIAVKPDGSQGYVTNALGSSVSILSTSRNAQVGTIGVGKAPTAVAIVPDQPPRASFWASPVRRQAGRKVTFHAGASSDPDGKITSYLWDFGDGKHMRDSQADQGHVYRRPGTYTATLTVVDDEGCSTDPVFTGQTAYCNGSDVAESTQSIVVDNNRRPVLHIVAPERQLLRAGHVSVRAICIGQPCGVYAQVGIELWGSRFPPQALRDGGSRSASLRAGSWRKLSIPLSRRARIGARRALAAGGKARAVVGVRATGANGNQTLRQNRVSLVAPRLSRSPR